MAREIKAVKGGKVHIKEDVEEIYEKKVTPYGNGAKLDAPKRHIGKKAFIIILKKQGYLCNTAKSYYKLCNTMYIKKCNKKYYTPPRGYQKLFKALWLYLFYDF